MRKLTLVIFLLFDLDSALEAQTSYYQENLDDYRGTVARGSLRSHTLVPSLCIWENTFREIPTSSCKTCPARDT